MHRNNCLSDVRWQYHVIMSAETIGSKMAIITLVVACIDPECFVELADCCPSVPNMASRQMTVTILDTKR